MHGANPKFEEESRKLLRSLQFESMEARSEAVKPAHQSTLQWIFYGHSSSFKDWSSAAGGIDWVQGKAGSGKSTLMRYLTKLDETHSIIQN